MIEGTSVPDIPQTILPARERWSELLGLEVCGAVEQILRRALLGPIEELTSIRGKRIRGQLVTFSYRLLCGDLPDTALAEKRCRLAAEAVEFIHAGSLIVDDIEDGSPVRRGRPALHLRHGMPVALNAGNWLYFWPFDLFKELARTEGSAPAHLRILPPHPVARASRPGHRSRRQNRHAGAKRRGECLRRFDPP